MENNLYFIKQNKQKSERKCNIETVLKKDFKFLQKISKSLENSNKNNHRTKKAEKTIELEETVSVRNATNDILKFLTSRDLFWRNLKK